MEVSDVMLCEEWGQAVEQRKKFMVERKTIMARAGLSSDMKNNLRIYARENKHRVICSIRFSFAIYRVVHCNSSDFESTRTHSRPDNVTFFLNVM
jgi:hypothetical protein